MGSSIKVVCMEGKESEAQWGQKQMMGSVVLVECERPQRVAVYGT